MPARRKDITKEVLEDLYLVQGLSQDKIAVRLNTTQPLIGKYMREFGIQVRTQSQAIMGSRHPNWQGGQKIERGYRFIYSPNHPAAQNRYVLEHILVMEKHLGRFLIGDEEIHHLNEVKTDNRLENLHLCANHSEHIRLFHTTPERTEAFKKMCKTYWTSEKRRAKNLQNPRQKDPITGRFMPK